MLTLFRRRRSGAGGFNPANLPGILQYALNTAPYYYEDTVSDYAVLRPLSGGDVRASRQPRAALFDGTDDYATLGRRLTSGSPTVLSVGGWVKFTGTGEYYFGSEYDSAANNRSWAIVQRSALPGKVSVFLSADGGTTNFKSYATNTATNINTNTWFHVAFTFATNTLKLFINGVEQTVTKTLDGTVNSLFNTPERFAIGAVNTSTTPAALFPGSMYDFRVYNTEKTAANWLAIVNQRTSDTVDTTGLLGRWAFQEENGLEAMDSSGNRAHLALNGINTATFHAIDSGVQYNVNNANGYTLGQIYSYGNILNATFTAADAIFEIEADVIVPPDDSVSRQVFAKTADSNLSENQRQFIVRFTGAKIFGIYYTALDSTQFRGAETNAALTPGASVTIKVRYDGSQAADSRLSFFVEGVSVASTITLTNGVIGASDDIKAGTAPIAINGYVNSAQTTALNLIAGFVTDALRIYNASSTLIFSASRASNWVDTVGAITPRTFFPRYLPAVAPDYSTDAYGFPVTVSGEAPNPMVMETPCVTGDGTAAYVNMATPLIPATADVDCELVYTHIGSGAHHVILDQRSSTSIGVLSLAANYSFPSVSANKLSLTIGNDPSFSNILSSVDLVVGVTYRIRFTRVGNLWSLYLNGVLVGTVTLSFSVSQTKATVLLAGFTTLAVAFSSGRIGNLQITTGGITKYFPLQEGAAVRDVYWAASDGTSGILTNAIVGGTIATIRANRIPGFAQDWAVNYGGGTNNNILTHSDQMDNAVWVKNAATVVANVEGVADRLVPNGTNNFHYAGQVITLVNGVTYTRSIEVKASGYNFVLLNTVTTTVGNAGPIVDLTNGTVAAHFTATLPTTILSLGDGWYRVAVTFVQAGTSCTIDNNILPTSAVASYTGNGTSGVLFRNAQLEVGSVLTPYHPTTTIAGNNAFVLGNIVGDLCADGSAKTLAAGNHGNPWSRLVPNVWNAPELNAIGVTTSTKLAPSDYYDASTPLQYNAFNRVAADGSDRYFATSTPLTGSALDNALEFTSAPGVIAKVGTFSSPTSTGTQAVTGIGFQPKLVMPFGTYPTADGNSTVLPSFFGAATGSAQAAIAFGSVGGVSPSVTSRRHTNAGHIAHTWNGIDSFAASRQSLDASGFTNNWTITTSPARIMNQISLGGEDVEVSITQHQMNATNAAQSLPHGLSGEPTALIVFCNGSEAVPSSNNGLQVGIGLWADSVQRSTWLYSQNTANPSNTGRSLTNSSIWNLFGFAKTIARSMQVSSVDATNVNVTYPITTVANQINFWIVAIRGAKAKVGSFDYNNSLSPVTITTAGMTPKLFMPIFIPTGADSPDTVANSMEMTIGASDGVSNISAGVTDAHAVSPTNSRRYQTSNALAEYDTAGGLSSSATAIFNGESVVITPTTITSTTYGQGMYLILGE